MRCYILKILIAVDSFKGSIDAKNACAAIAAGVLQTLPGAQVTQVPISDGGEGFLHAVVSVAGQGEIIETRCLDPLGRVISASFGRIGDTAVIEAAEANGLDLVPQDKRDPDYTTTFGVGMLIKAALDAGLKKIVIGVGGSATNDGGVGMAQALGISFTDGFGRQLPFGGKYLGRLAGIDISRMDGRVLDAQITVACDVENPLCGHDGAAYIYAAQKGATPKQIKSLDAGLKRLGKLIKADLGQDIANIAGAGAAGGLAGGLVAFVNAKLSSGANTVLDAAGFDDKLKECDFVITGEGKLDKQTLKGKAVSAVAARAAGFEKPAFAIVGDCDGTQMPGIAQIIKLVDLAKDKDEAIKNPEQYLRQAANQVAEQLKR